MLHRGVMICHIKLKTRSQDPEQFNWIWHVWVHCHPIIKIHHQHHEIHWCNAPVHTCYFFGGIVLDDCKSDVDVDSELSWLFYFAQKFAQKWSWSRRSIEAMSSFKEILSAKALCVWLCNIEGLRLGEAQIVRYKSCVGFTRWGWWVRKVTHLQLISGNSLAQWWGISGALTFMRIHR